MKKWYLTISILIYVSSLMAQGTSTFTDPRDRKTYKTVKIGNQVWMAENLAYKADSTCWAYNNDTANVVKYGYLYTWETAKTVCPGGWKLPSKDDFDILLGNYQDYKVAYSALGEEGKSGFSAKYVGKRFKDGLFYLGIWIYFWSSTSRYSNIYRLSIFDINGSASMTELPNFGEALPVRCLKDN